MWKKEKFIVCEYEYINDVIDKNDNLTVLAGTALKRLEKLSSVNKKISNETITSIKDLKDPSKIGT